MGGVGVEIVNHQGHRDLGVHRINPEVSYYDFAYLYHPLKPLSMYHQVYKSRRCYFGHLILEERESLTIMSQYSCVERRTHRHRHVPGPKPSRPRD